MQNDPLIKSIRTELKAGTYPNTRILAVEVEEAPAMSVGASFDNYKSFVVGENQGTGSVEFLNLSGIGDRGYVQYNWTEGLSQGEVGYSAPLNARDGTLSVRYSSGSSRVVAEPLEPFDLTAESQEASLTWRQPIIQEPNEELALSIGLRWQQDLTFLLGKPFGFNPDLPDGVSRSTSLQFTQEYLRRSPQWAFAFRSEFSVGLDLFNATVLDNKSGLDGRFFLWRGQLEWVQKLSDDLLWRISLQGQLTGDALLAGEKFQIGGIDTVRGFPYNFQNGDSGINVRIEFPYTPINSSQWGTVTISPFFDWAAVSNNYYPTFAPDSVASLGVGIEWNWQNFSVRLDYANPFEDVEGKQNLLFSMGITSRF